jgi:hypothetical protein
MEKMIAYCGLDCSECGALIATRENDDTKRREVAAKWSQQYHVDFRPEDINCVGCTTAEGPHVGHWSMCEVHNCGAEKGVINCAYCDDYGCEKLEGYFKMAPGMKENLEEVRKGLT